MKIDSPQFQATLDIVLLLLVAGLFWKINIYLSLGVLIFHGLSILQLFKTRNLLGEVNYSSTMKQKIFASLFILILIYAVGIQVIKNGFPTEERLVEISTREIIEIANGEAFPYLILLCFLSALLMFGITTERRKR